MPLTVPTFTFAALVLGQEPPGVAEWPLEDPYEEISIVSPETPLHPTVVPSFALLGPPSLPLSRYMIFHHTATSNLSGRQGLREYQVLSLRTRTARDHLENFLAIDCTRETGIEMRR